MANEIAVLQKDITDTVSSSLSRLEEEGLQLPPNYNAQNALKSAFFKMKEVKDKSNKSALEVCSKESIANTLLDMVTQGLSPAKTQCYFVVYGNQLKLNRSYFGTQAVIKRLNKVKDIWANVIFEGDEFDYSVTDGRERLLKHETKFQNRDNEILGAYAIVKTEDDEILTVMTKKEIDASWSQTRSGGAVQKKFPQEMAKRTVINRAAKAYINTSDDSDLLVEAINKTTENEYENGRREVDPIDDVQDEIENEANQTVVDFEQPTEPKQKKPRKTAEPVNEEPTDEQQAMFDNLNDLMPDEPEF